MPQPVINPVEAIIDAATATFWAKPLAFVALIAFGAVVYFARVAIDRLPEGTPTEPPSPRVPAITAGLFALVLLVALAAA